MVSARMKATLLLAAVLVAAGVAVAIALSRDTPAPGTAEDHGMADDDRCAHMPEHCEPTRGRARG